MQNNLFVCNCCTVHAAQAAFYLTTNYLFAIAACAAAKRAIGTRNGEQDT